VAEEKLAKIIVRNGTTAQWTSANTVLDKGEIGIEDLGTGSACYRMKIGDGTTAWLSLPYHDGSSIYYPVTGVDLTATGQTVVYTTPSGMWCIPEKLLVFHRVVSDPGSSSTTSRFGTTALPGDMFSGQVISATAANDVSSFSLENKGYAGSTQLEFGVTVASGSSTHTVDLLLKVTLFPV
jgi:hypothetical protein